MNVLSRLKCSCRLLAAFSFIALLWGCGYSFAPQGEHIDRRIQNVYVEPFVNQTAESELENAMRSAFIDQFIQSRRFKVVQSVDQADAVVSGAILNLFTTTLSYRSNILAAEERATVLVQASFVDRQSGKTIWSSRQVRGSVDYEVQDDINLLTSTRRNAYGKLAADTAERAFNQMMSDF